MAGSVVGTAYVRLRLLTDTIGKDIEKSVKKSDLQNIDIRVDADTGKAALELKKLGAESDELGRKSPTITPKVDTKQAKKDTSLLRDALVLLGPTVGPLGAVAASAFGLLAASAGVAVLAVKGVEKEMKTGTATGVAFSGGIQKLKADLSTLEATAAKGVLPGFQATVTSLNSAMPGVNRSVGDLSAILGDIGSRVVVGLVSGLQTFEPLLKHIAIEADNAAGHFQKWATGPGGAGFAQTLGTQFDKVVPVLANLAAAVGKLIAAFLPVGDHIVGIIGALAAAINAIPLPILKVLADVFVTLYSANRLIALFTNLSLSLVKFGASAGVASVSMGSLAVGASEFALALGPVAAILITGFTATQAFGGVLDKLANKFATGKVTASQNSDELSRLNGIYTELTGQAQASSATLLKFALSGQVAGRQYDAFSTQIAGLIPHLKGLGLTTDDVETAVSGSDVAFDKWIATVEKHGGATKDDIKALEGLHNAFQYTSDSIGLSQAALAKLTTDPAWGRLVTSSASVDQLAAKFHLSSSAVTQYASLLGISSDAIKNGVVTNKQLAAAVSTVSSAYNTATTSGATFLDALAKFSTSAGTAADRAQLIGSYLKASQGDLLSYSGAVASAYQANFALTQAFQSQGDKMAKLRDQIGKGKLDSVQLGIAQRSLQRDLSSTEFAAINLKTGLIDVTKQGAGPLIQQLQGMQDAAMAAAAATYQHEVRLRGAGRAAADAAQIFKTQTYDALVKDAAQLGLTTKQAEALATSYFDLPKDVATKVRAIGTDPVVTVLNKIGELLAYMVGRPWNPKVSVNTGTATRNLQNVTDKLGYLRDKNIQVTADVSPAEAQINALYAQFNQRNLTIRVGAGANAPGGGAYAGGGSVGDGWFTVGEAGYEIGYKSGSNVQIISHDKARKMTGVDRVPGYAGGATTSKFEMAPTTFRMTPGLLESRRLALARRPGVKGLSIDFSRTGGYYDATKSGLTTADASTSQRLLALEDALMDLAAAVRDRPVNLIVNGRKLGEAVEAANAQKARR